MELANSLIKKRRQHALNVTRVLLLAPRVPPSASIVIPTPTLSEQGCRHALCVSIAVLEIIGRGAALSRKVSVNRARIRWFCDIVETAEHFSYKNPISMAV